MRKLIIVCAVLAISTLLQACGGSKSTKTTPTGVTAINAVHNIEPDKVNEYIANFKTQYAQIEFQFEGNTIRHYIFRF